MSHVPMLTSQALLDSSHIFQEDNRLNNPKLHLFYTTQAVEHLRAIDVAMQSLSKFCNLNMHSIVGCMHQERLVLVRNNAAYCQADAILQSLNLAVNTKVVPAFDDSTPPPDVEPAGAATGHAPSVSLTPDEEEEIW